MIHLDSIKIKGFKDPEAEKELVFSTEPISVIYGENGSGKTTMLKILYAILSRDERTLSKENVMRVELNYREENQTKQLIVERKNIVERFSWSRVFESKSILFGIHRGMVQEKGKIQAINSEITRNINAVSNDELVAIYDELEDICIKIDNIEAYLELKTMRKKADPSKGLLLQFIYDMEDAILGKFSHNSSYFKVIQVIKGKLRSIKINAVQNSHSPKNILKVWEKQSHLSLDMIQMEDIETALINQYQKGQEAVSQKIKNAFLETIEKALEIDEQSDKDFSLPDDFEEKIEKHKNFILNAIKTTKENSTLTKRIENYLATKNKSLTDKSKIFRAMLLEMVESAEEPNPTLESITALMSIFNDHLYHQKKLVIEEESAFIDLGNGKKHDLADLSSGERNLLTILTLFLIVGNNRNFLLIDEPEISFNIKWQRRFLPLLSKINTQAQIIVASHSPSIAHQNSQYLVQLL
jgi:ABC-type lipoprotein export system ATPase subunit